ncbi:MAG: lysylphosphatidylglycerol synthase transmembrane domain-containing protein [Methanothrix soehngenii]|nr:lysylphosphatidylglycerol synthase transmembrane domain-containing protein [Methanothrix soehngenii]
MDKKNQALIAAATVTAVLLYLLLSQIDPHDIISTLKGIDASYLAGGFILYLLCNIFRALRFHILLDQEIKLFPLFNLVCIYNMMNNLAPMRTGELSYIYMLKKLHNKNAITGASTLILSRIFDFIAIGTLFLASAWMIGDRLGGMKSILIPISLFMIFCLILLLMLFYGGEWLSISFSCALDRMGLARNATAIYLISNLKEMVQSMQKLRNAKIALLILASSFIIWAANFFVVFLVIRGMHFDIPMPIIVMGSTFTVLSTLLPIYGIAGLGTSQGLWTLVFLPLGIPLDQAIISAFGYYIVQMAYYLVLGSYGLAMIKLTDQEG